jgi:predicted metal-dependent peptidase
MKAWPRSFLAISDMHQTDDNISGAVTQLLLKEPFFAHLLGNLSREISNRTPTVALEKTQGGYSLIVNPEYFDQVLTTREQRVAAIKHEALHFVFSHVFRAKKFEHQEVYNQAADLVVNQYLEPWPSLPDALTLELLDERGVWMNRDESVEYYYEELLKIREQNEEGDGGEGESGGIDGILQESMSATSQRGDHQFWANQSADDAEQTQHDEMMSQAAQRSQDWGKLPGPLQQLINAMLERREPQVDWRRSLRLFAACSGRTSVAHTMKRISKRYGTRPGTRIKRYSKLAIALDTSGSVDDDTLSTFFSEIHSIWKHGAEVVIIECDAEVQQTYPYRGQTPQDVAGRGGTAFDPVFEHLNQNRQQQFDGCIYLTDGWADTPEVKPPCKVLWVICSDGTDEYVNFGPAIQLQD